MKKRLVDMTLPAVALLSLMLLAGLAAPPPAIAASLPRTVQLPSCFCGADFNRDGLADRGTIASLKGSTFIRLWLSGRREPLRLRVGKGIVEVVALDVDRDGDTDLVALKTNLRVRVWLNNGHGEFVRRNQPALRISFGSRIGLGDAQQPAAFCCSSLREDGANLPRAVGALAAAGPEPSEAKGLESNDRAMEDAFLAATHPRGPPCPSFAA